MRLWVLAGEEVNQRLRRVFGQLQPDAPSRQAIVDNQTSIQQAVSRIRQ